MRAQITAEVVPLTAEPQLFRDFGVIAGRGTAAAKAASVPGCLCSRDEEFKMGSSISKQWVAAPLAALLLFAASNGAQAKGCLKGAAVGALAGHVARHHAVLGAAAGCVVGHHLEKKKERKEKEQRKQERREAQTRGS
ncbi:MAG: hypothetical protein ACHQHL_00955 [Steroidobacterales bacterium]|jgi:hypothetical protein